MEVPTAGPSWQQASVTIATTLIGAGVLGLPYAMRRAGWFGFVLMMISTLVASFTAKQLVWSFNTVNERKQSDPDLLGKGFVRTYDQLAEELLGERGGAAMQVLTVLECYGCAICYVVLHAVNWPVVLRLPDTVALGLPAPVACVSCWAVCVLPLLLVRPRFLSYFASVGLVAVASLFVVNAAAPALAGYPLDPSAPCLALDSSVSEREVAGERPLLRTDGLGIAAGLILFCFGGHATFPELYAQMSAEERPHFNKSLTVGCAIAGAFYLFFGGFSFYYFGGCLADTVTLNLMAVSPLLGSVATVAVLMNTFMTFPVFVTPVLRILESVFYKPEDIEQLEEVGAVSEEALFREAVVARLDTMQAAIEMNAAVLTRLAKHMQVALPTEVLGDVEQNDSPGASASALALAGFTKAGGSSWGSRGHLAVLGGGGHLKRRTISMVAESDADDAAGGLDTPEEKESIFIGLNTLTFSLRVGLVLLAAFLAVSVPNFGFLVALMGCVTTMLVSFILPTAFYLQVHWRSGLSVPTLVGCFGILLLGFVGMGIGLYNTLVAGI